MIKGMKTKSANGTIEEAKYLGSAEITTVTSNNQMYTIHFPMAIYQPSTPVNLISSKQLKNMGIGRDTYTDTLVHISTKRELAQIEWSQDIACIKTIPPTVNNNSLPQLILATINYATMHRRLFHAGKEVIQRACKDANIDICDTKVFCEPCVMAKATDEYGKQAPPMTTVPLEYIRTDVITHREPGHLGYKYSVHFVDVASNFQWVKFVVAKKDAFQALQEWVKWIETQTGHCVKIIGLDGGGEFGQSTRPFQNDRLIQWARGKGIQIMTTTPHTPWMNGKVERMGRTICEKTRAIMLDNNVPSHLWPFTMETATRIQNLLPTRANANMLSPHEVFAKALKLPETKPYIKHLRAYFCDAYYYIKTQKRLQSDKFAARAGKAKLIGYVDMHGKIYWLWDPKTNKIIRASAVRFNDDIDTTSTTDTIQCAPVEYEAAFTDTNIQETEQAVRSVRTTITSKPPRTKSLPDIDKPPTSLSAPAPPTPTTGQCDNVPGSFGGAPLTPEMTPEYEENEVKQEIEEDAPPLRRSGRTKHVDGWYNRIAKGSFLGMQLMTKEKEMTEYMINLQLVMFTLASIRHQVPKNYRQALKSPLFNTHWLPAMQKQHRSLTEHRVWDLIDLPPGAKVLPGKWVYDIKEVSTEELLYRARWVACGNYEEWSDQATYAAVAHAISVRIFLIIVAIFNLECLQFDFKTAFLNAAIPTSITYYIEQPTGMEYHPGKVCRLNKALYGLRTSALFWFEELKPVLAQMGFKSLQSEICMFVNEKENIYVILYVDDFLIAGPSRSRIQEIAHGLNKRFELKELGDVSYFLGFDISRDREARTIHLSQRTYIENLLDKYGASEMNGVQTPWPAGLTLSKKDTTVSQDVIQKYMKLTGSLNWIATGTRPDITYTVNQLASANNGPSTSHHDLAKHLLRYLKRTSSFGLTLGGADNLSMITYADASFADDVDTRHSMGGYIVTIGGAPVAWKSKRQTFVTLSSTEAEFCNLTPAFLLSCWVRDILAEAGHRLPKPIQMYTDSANARSWILNPTKAASSRSVDIRYKWIIERVKSGELDLRHIPGTEMVADGLTKPLRRELHTKFIRLLGLTENSPI